MLGKHCSNGATSSAFEEGYLSPRVVALDSIAAVGMLEHACNPNTCLKRCKKKFKFFPSEVFAVAGDPT